jgi:hypothetical protein
MGMLNSPRMSRDHPKRKHIPPIPYHVKFEPQKISTFWDHCKPSAPFYAKLAKSCIIQKNRQISIVINSWRTPKWAVACVRGVVCFAHSGFLRVIFRIHLPARLPPLTESDYSTLKGGERVVHKNEKRGWSRDEH